MWSLIPGWMEAQAAESACHGCLQVREYQAHHIEAPGTTVTTTKAELVQFFESMYRMRRMEIAADMLYKSKLIRGFCHL